jgi:DNA-binding MarR family transcriptional regulator
MTRGSVEIEGGRMREETEMSEEHKARAKAVGELFFACLYNIQQTAAPDWRGLDVTMAQMKVLVTLSVGGEIGISKLAETLGISHPTASHLVERLVQAKLVVRVESAIDRRYTLASLSSQGQATMQRLHQGRQEHLQHWLTQLGAQDLDALGQGLEALQHAVQAVCAQEPDGRAMEDRQKSDL